MCLSFVGKKLIFLPTAEFCAVSRKITSEEERARLTGFAEKLRADGGGFVFRTNAQGAQLRELKEEAGYLRGLYAAAQEAYKNAAVGDLIYRDADVNISDWNSRFMS